jgi:hypothetical protein
LVSLISRRCTQLPTSQSVILGLILAARKDAAREELNATHVSICTEHEFCLDRSSDARDDSLSACPENNGGNPLFDVSAAGAAGERVVGHLQRRVT